MHVWAISVYFFLLIVTMKHSLRSRKKQRKSWLANWKIRLLLGLLPLHFCYVLFCRYVLPPTTLTQLSAVLTPRVQFHREYVPKQRISRYLFLALMAGEDTPFLHNSGFSWAEIRQGLAAGRGGSGISQQTAKNAFTWQNRDWLRKGLESYSTVLIEWLWGKERIIEVYANIIEFEEGVYGVEAISQEIFHKSASEIDRKEAAMIVAFVPRPKGGLRGDWTKMRKVQAHILKEMAALENQSKVRLFLDRMARSD
jgi:monofunctional glycosyltransferase